jgi:hypothetical protein
MTKRLGGTAAKNGFYWNLGKWEMTMVPKQGGLLPGDAGDKYVRVPVLGLLVVAPVMGAAYAMFLPFIGFVMLFSFLFKKMFAATRVGVSGVAATMTPEWRPGEAYLAGKTRAAGDAENGEAVAEEVVDGRSRGPQTVEARRKDLKD